MERSRSKSRSPGGRARGSPLKISDDTIAQIAARLHRVEGQVRAIARMVEERRDCHEIAQQLAAANAALTRATVQLMTTSMAQCIKDGAAGEPELERLSETFVKLLT